MRQANSWWSSRNQIACQLQIGALTFFKPYCFVQEERKEPPKCATDFIVLHRLNNQQKQYLLDMMVNGGLVTSSVTSFSCSNCLSFWNCKCWISSFLHSDCSSCVSISSWISSELRERSTRRTWAKMDGWISEEQKTKIPSELFRWVTKAHFQNECPFHYFLNTVICEKLSLYKLHI